jgi:hypothetical protein
LSACASAAGAADSANASAAMSRRAVLRMIPPIVWTG